MDGRDSLRLMVRHFPGGIESMAPRLGIAVSTLEKQLRGALGYKLDVATIEQICALCHEAGSPHRAAYATAIAGVCGGSVSLEHTRNRPGPADLVQDVSRAMRDVSEVASVALEAGSDGRISLNERRALSREVGEAIEALQRLEADFKAEHEAGIPHHLRAA